MFDKKCIDRRSVCFVEQLICGDDKSWSVFIENIVRPAVRKCLRETSYLCCDSWTENSIVSNVSYHFVKNDFENLKKFRFECKLSTYVYKAVAYIMMSEVNKTVSRRECELDALSIYAKSDVLKEVNRHEDICSARIILQRLYSKKPFYYCVVCLRIILEKTSAESAKILKTSCNCIDISLYRAKKELNKLMDDYIINKK